jgi:glutamate-1-semialdehyde 2,1-aminomutase
MCEFQLDAQDAKLSEELAAYLPDKVFDAHAHLFLKRDFNLEAAPILGELPNKGGIDFWRASLSAQVGEKRVSGGLFFGWPVLPRYDMKERINRANSFLIDELQQNELSNTRGLLLVANSSNQSEVESLLDEEYIAGFKPYAALNPECGSAPDIHEYLPEWVCQLADECGLIVVLHILKPKALDDDGNITEISNLCTRYPRMKLVLAHAGSGFNMYNTIKGCKRLNKFDNLWFDLSAVCESQTIAALIKAFGSERLLWGTDYPVSLRKGRFATLGNTFVGIQKDTIKGSVFDAVLLGLENIRSVLQAAHDCRIRSSEVEGIFYDNAAELLSSKLK